MDAKIVAMLLMGISLSTLIDLADRMFGSDYDLADAFGKDAVIYYGYCASYRSVVYEISQCKIMLDRIFNINGEINRKFGIKSEINNIEFKPICFPVEEIVSADSIYKACEYRITSNNQAFLRGKSLIIMNYNRTEYF
jgi:hypothetical protein